MRALIDTHVFLWLKTAPDKLSKTALNAWENEENTVFISLASIWEMQIKRQIGKLELDIPLKDMIDEQRKINELKILPIEMRHILGLDDLPFYHKDPFDRLIISQAKIEGIKLISSDSFFSDYDVELLW